jgi:ribonuclease HI
MIDGSKRREAPNSKQMWETPPSGRVKWNTDVAFCYESGGASSGIIMRDESGSVLLTAWKIVRACASPEQAEAEALLHGLRLATEWVRQPIWVETDCLNLIRDLTKTIGTRSSMTGILADIQAVGRLLPECSFHHISREANQVAHLLAHKALEDEQCGSLCVLTPLYVYVIIGLSLRLPVRTMPHQHVSNLFLD